ncbi:MAG TPA: SprT family zinc-dependent metalloprotease [Pseudomonas xinjiangensis]|uniref:SprT family zinc-dependent metalloprotease n=2 Tax=root TaxID=1 RepID=A0A7V1FTB2_9GAMM|nr:SprT family zinc-dependent metalloprotease [Halopseudomonas xinjiangensis]HEC48813.1 SprT family zinc-dependent metalloprotease [Halopseudomonas xinjiangensis]
MEQLLASLETCYQLAEVRFQRRFERPTVTLDLKGQRAGVAYLNRNLLRFNGQMYQDHSDDFLKQTVPHEVAHLIAHALYGGRIRPHGSQWQALMIELFGLPAKRCHDYPVPEGRRRTNYVYQCSCPGPVPFTAQRHAWVGRGRRYQCRRCGTILQFTGQRNIA